MKWYKQKVNEHVNADLRKNFKSDSHEFISINGIIHILKQRIAEKIDLKEAKESELSLHELSSIRMDKAMFETVVMCKDWKFLTKLLTRLNQITDLTFEEDGDVIVLNFPHILKELDNYTQRAFNKLVVAGSFDETSDKDVPTSSAHSKHSVGLEDSTGKDNTSTPTLTRDLDMSLYIHKHTNTHLNLSTYTHKETGEIKYFYNDREISLEKFNQLDS